MKITDKEALEKYLHQVVIDVVAIAGGQSALARLIGVSQGHVWNWLNRNKKIPSSQAVPIEIALGFSRYKSRPDIFGENQTYSI